MDTPRNDTDLAADLRDDGQHEAADRIDALAADVAGLTAAIDAHAAWLEERRAYWLDEYDPSRPPHGPRFLLPPTASAPPPDTNRHDRPMATGSPCSGGRPVPRLLAGQNRQAARLGSHISQPHQRHSRPSDEG